MTTAPVAATIGDAISTPDRVMHAVTALAGKRLELACGLLVKGSPIVESPEGLTMCVNCATGTKAVVEPTQEAPTQDAPAPTQEPAVAEQAGPRIANQPTREAAASRTIGHYTIEQPKRDGPFRVRDTRSGKLEAGDFELAADAAWFAQRRYRLSEFKEFGGTSAKKLFMPKVPGNKGPYTIVGELGATHLELDGQRVGPIWRHKTNSKVDALRYAERLLRPGRATA